MISLYRLLRLDPATRRLLIEAGLWLAAVRVGLTLLGFRRLNRLLGLWFSEEVRGDMKPPLGPFREHRSEADRVFWAVSAAGRRIPGGRSCLVQALAARLLLARSGIRSRLRLGAARGEGNRFEAHAWLEWGGLGGLGLRHLQELHSRRSTKG